MPLSPAQLQDLRAALLRRRNAILSTARSEDTEAEELRGEGVGGRPPEYEEAAQKSAAESTLRSLSLSQRHEAEAIDDALRRMEAGTYGKCASCAEEIPYERLVALPFTTLDAGCAARAELEQKPRPSMLESKKL